MSDMTNEEIRDWFEKNPPPPAIRVTKLTSSLGTVFIEGIGSRTALTGTDRKVLKEEIYDGRIPKKGERVCIDASIQKRPSLLQRPA